MPTMPMAAADSEHPIVRCPRCDVFEGCYLPFVSLEALVDYYRCAACCHIWTFPKIRAKAMLRVDSPAPLPTAMVTPDRRK